MSLPTWWARRRGRTTEDLAERWLKDQGLRPGTRNYQCRMGEIDLVMHEGDTLVFIEVRYRRSLSHGGALASVDSHKQRRLIQAARHYLARHPRAATGPCRFDVIGVSGEAGRTEFEWIRNAFFAE